MAFSVCLCVCCACSFTGVWLCPRGAWGAGVVTVAAQEAETSWQGLFSDLKWDQCLGLSAGLGSRERISFLSFPITQVLLSRVGKEEEEEEEGLPAFC